MRIFKVGAAVVLAGAAAAQEAPHFEMDVIFPRNETYKATDFFPVAIVLQNTTAPRLLGNYTVPYKIVGIKHHHEPRETYYFPMIESEMQAVEGVGGGDGDDDFAIYVANTNATDWIQKREWGMTYELQVHTYWDDYSDRCGRHVHYQTITVPFAINDSYSRNEYTGPTVDPDVMAVPKCPAFPAMVEMRPNATDESCSWPDDENSTIPVDPCAVVVDDKMKRLLLDKASSMPAPSETPEFDPSIFDTPSDHEEEEDAATGLRPIVAVVWAASFALGCLAFAI